MIHTQEQIEEFAEQLMELDKWELAKTLAKATYQLIDINIAKAKRKARKNDRSSV